MANICSNQYRFVFSTEEAAKKFVEFVKKETEENSSVYLLGIKAGIADANNRDVREWEDTVSFRSPENKKEVMIYSESKWTPCPNAWNDIAKTFDERVATYYEAEEPGCGIWASNDPDFIGKFVVDPCVGEGFPEIDKLNYGVYDYEEVVKILNRLLTGKGAGILDDLETLLSKLKASKYKDVLYVNEIIEQPLSDWKQ